MELQLEMLKFNLFDAVMRYAAKLFAMRVNRIMSTANRIIIMDIR